MLRACHRLLRRGGRVAIYTIALMPGLSPAQRRRGHDNGPPNVASRLPYAPMMARAGFKDVRVRDVTGAFLRTARAWNEHRARRKDELIEVEGEQAFRERQSNNTRQQRAIEEGLLQRLLLTAVRR